MALISNTLNLSFHDEISTPLHRTLGNTKLKTRQDVRRFRKFLKGNFDLQSMALVDIDPQTLRIYLMNYLTTIRTRKGLKYDPETLRSYYLSIQRFLKDSNYPFCLRNSPHFAPCRDFIIQMRKEKNENNSFSQTMKMKKSEDDSISLMRPSTSSDEQTNSSSPINSNLLLTKDLLPSSSLPPRKRQKMKYFLELNSTNDFSPVISSPLSSVFSPMITSLSSDAYSLLVHFARHSSSSRSFLDHCEQLLDQSLSCGSIQRLMLTSLCHQWTGDIRLIHSNLRQELNSFLPHILVLNILSSKRIHS